jgi:hypothetical protein
MSWVVFIPFNVPTDLGLLRKKADELAASPSECQWERRGDEFAISFRSGRPAAAFVAYCVRYGIQNRREWPQHEIEK